MTGFAFILFTFYMITDPATSPSSGRGQVIFAVSVASMYALFMELHVVFGLFYALTVVTAGRGIVLWLASVRDHAAHSPAILTGIQAATAPAYELPRRAA
jgi:hypothetical protein